MANYFNTLPLRLQLEQLGKCRFMDQSEFSKLLTHDEIAKNEVMSVLSDDSFIYKAITPSRANTRLNDNAPDENSKSSLSKYNIILKQVGNDLAD